MHWRCMLLVAVWASAAEGAFPTAPSPAFDVDKIGLAETAACTANSIMGLGFAPDFGALDNQGQEVNGRVVKGSASVTYTMKKWGNKFFYAKSDSTVALLPALSVGTAYSVTIEAKIVGDPADPSPPVLSKPPGMMQFKSNATMFKSTFVWPTEYTRDEPWNIEGGAEVPMTGVAAADGFTKYTGVFVATKGLVGTREMFWVHFDLKQQPRDYEVSFVLRNFCLTRPGATIPAPTRLSSYTEKFRFERPVTPGSAELTQQSGCPFDEAGLQTWESVFGTKTTGTLELPGNAKVVVGAQSFVAGARYTKIVVPATSELIFRDEAVALTVKAVVVQGKLRIGSETCRMQGPIKMTFWGQRGDPATDLDGFGSKGLAVTGSGEVDMFGRRFFPTWVRLARQARAGDDRVYLQEAVNWYPGQEVAVLTTIPDDTGKGQPHQNEVMTVKAVGGAGRVVQFTAELAYNHYAGTEYQGEVALLSRHIMLEGEPDADGYGAHFVVAGKRGRVAGVASRYMGQTNIMARYPFHFHLLGADSGSYFSDNVARDTYFRCFVIHGTHGSRVSENVAFNATGSCYYVEDGVEENNTVSYNMAAHVHVIGKPAAGPGQEGQIIEQDVNPGGLTSGQRIQPADASATGFYFSNAYNSIVGNVASGGWSGFGFPGLPEPIGEMKNANIVPKSRTIKKFSGNTAHSTGWYWASAGGVYVGGELKHTDDSKTRLVWNSGFAERSTMTTSHKGAFEWDVSKYLWPRFENTLLYCVNVGFLHWGSRVEIDGFEVHDASRSGTLFGQAWMGNGLVNAESGNLPALTDRRHHDGFRFYDTAMNTLITSTEFRNFKKRKCVPNFLAGEEIVPAGDEGCAKTAPYLYYNVIWSSLYYSDVFKPQHINSVNKIKYTNVDRELRLAIKTLKSGASRQFNLVDYDGSTAGTGYPTVVGSYVNWWQLCDDCKYEAAWSAWLCPKRPANYEEREVVHINVLTPDIAPGSGGIGKSGSCNVWKNADTQDWSNCNVGYMALWNSPGLPIRKLDITQNAGITGLTGTGWYMRLNKGTPKKFTIEPVSIPNNSTLRFAISYPAGTKFTIKGVHPDTRYLRVYTEAACIAEVWSAPKFDKYYFDGTNLFLRPKLVWELDPSGRGDEGTWFERDGARIYQRVYNWVLTVEADCAANPEGYCVETAAEAIPSWTGGCPGVPPVTTPAPQTPSPPTPAPPTAAPGPQPKDECLGSPCGKGQTSLDPQPVLQSTGDFVCTCANGVSAKGAMAVCSKDECLPTNPCGAGQTCNDPNKAANKLHDFACTCDSDKTIMKTDGPATCSKDECVSNPCGSGQTCKDPTPSPKSTGDFVCTCANGVSATGASATCSKDECLPTNPCGAGQTCNDPNKAANKLHDFACTCDSDKTIMKTDGPATCSKDECVSNPCGSGQICKDPTPSPKSTGDFVCTCANGVSAKGAMAACSKDECLPTNPCGAGQTCNDPNKAANKLHDFACTCDSDKTIMKTDGPATCSKDECVSNPCGSGQTCKDLTPSPKSTGDFVCTCANGVSATGASATCSKDECLPTNPCGAGQTCNDPNKAANKLHDFACTCDSDKTIIKTDGPATCSKDECVSNPCGSGQTCKDPTPSPKSTGDFVCTCANGVSAKGAMAACSKDECLPTNPCGAGQTCNDPNKAANKLHDFACTCDSDKTIMKTDGPATCSKDECVSNPCGSGQTCKVPTPSPKSTGDFVCTCANGVSATGASATCTKDECLPANPCGAGQTCNDPNKAANKLHDFACTCDSDKTIMKTDGPATCSKDECVSNPCGSGQTCKDPTPSPKSTGDFVCTCANGVSAKGAMAVCSKDECLPTNPCGAGQTCSDPNKAADKLQDFICACVLHTSVTSSGAAVSRCQTEECATSPCGQTQACSDPNTSPLSVKDFICTCPAPNTGLSQVGQPAVCAQGTNNECDAKPCGPTQTCADPDQSGAATLDYVCTCTVGQGSQTGAPATCVSDECDAMPCGAGQTCKDPSTSALALQDYVCTCVSDGTSNTGARAVCLLDECATQPCAQGQTCNDPTQTPEQLKDFTCTCGNGVTSTGAAASCVMDECTSAPCGSDQTCSDPNTASNKLHDFVCTCIADALLTRIDGPATCTKDECVAKPCASGQTCFDPTQTLSSLQDFTCTCANGVVATGGPATCVTDECLTTPGPCGTDQTCNDPNTASDKLHDFVCTCIADALLTRIDGPATCMKDECVAKPCASGQTCFDPTQTLSSLQDFTCTCANGVTATGGPATCVTDECLTTPGPCGTDQTCNDPNTASDKLHDFVCTCIADALLTRIDGPATCTKDECAAKPCASGQTCFDPTQTLSSLQDFTCTCANDVVATGGPATCIDDECVAHPCGPGQLCNDPNTAANSHHDFVCTCRADANIIRIDGPATCTKDECVAKPCASGQTCFDPTQTLSSLHDFTCTCANGVNATGAAATCVTDECLTTPGPCGADQTCSDPNTASDNLHDFVCTCIADALLTRIDGPATCTKDECVAKPCASGQTCFDPTQTLSSLQDFTCTCANGVVATGGPATCVDDECVAHPCGPGQLCNDPNTAANSHHDFVCTCQDIPSRSRVDGPVTCTKDECLSKPCPLSQACFDPVHSLESIGDFTCTCSNGLNATGGAASCTDNECDTHPCGSDQTCQDPNQAANSHHDFVCRCRDDETLWKVDGPVTCSKDECAALPCGEGQTCFDPMPTLASLHDYTCTCGNGVNATNGRATCILDECSGNPCGGWQLCTDPDTSYTTQHDFICTCPATGATAVDSPAPCQQRNCTGLPAADLCRAAAGCGWHSNGCHQLNGQWDECASDPCGKAQLCSDASPARANFMCTCTFGDRAAASGRPATGCLQGAGVEDDSGSGFPVWGWVLIAVGGLAVCGMAGFAYSRSQEGPVSLEDFMSIEEDDMSDYHNPHGPSAQGHVTV